MKNQNHLKLLRPTSPNVVFCRTDVWSNQIYLAIVTTSHQLRNDTSHPMVGMAFESPPGRTCGMISLLSLSVQYTKLYQRSQWYIHGRVQTLYPKKLFHVYVLIFYKCFPVWQSWFWFTQILQICVFCILLRFIHGWNMEGREAPHSKIVHCVGAIEHEYIYTLCIYL